MEQKQQSTSMLGRLTESQVSKSIKCYYKFSRFNYLVHLKLLILPYMFIFLVSISVEWQEGTIKREPLHKDKETSHERNKCLKRYFPDTVECKMERWLMLNSHKFAVHDSLSDSQPWTQSFRGLSMGLLHRIFNIWRSNYWGDPLSLLVVKEIGLLTP